MHRDVAHYDQSYFQWQNTSSTIGAKLEATKFQRYISQHHSVLDFGCGGGNLLAALNAAQKLGVEINPVARCHAQSLGLETVDSLDEVPDDSFDVAISNHALEHTESPLSIIDLVRKKLKPGGTAVFVVPCERYDTTYNPANIDKHLYTWSPMNLGNLFDRAGFEVERAEFLLHRFPPKLEVIDKYFGNSGSNFASRIFGILSRRSTQARVVAKKPG